jgi:hypothetical protein
MVDHHVCPTVVNASIHIDIPVRRTGCFENPAIPEIPLALGPLDSAVRWTWNPPLDSEFL